MELLSPDFVSFLSALAAIIVIDLMLAGDNAIMIALAARNVPKHLQRRVILWGTAGAIAVRVAMTLVVVWLLKIPGLAAAGGLLLVWIAYRLLVHTDTGDTGERSSPHGRRLLGRDADHRRRRRCHGSGQCPGRGRRRSGKLGAGDTGAADQHTDRRVGQHSHAALDPALPGHHLPRRRRAGLDRSHDDRGRASHPGPSRRAACAALDHLRRCDRGRPRGWAICASAAQRPRRAKGLAHERGRAHERR